MEQTCRPIVEHDFGCCRISIVAARIKSETSLERLIIRLWKLVSFIMCQIERLGLSNRLLALWRSLDINCVCSVLFYVGHFMWSHLSFYFLGSLLFSTGRVYF